LETWICVHNLQRGTIRRRRWRSWKEHETVEEMEMATFRMGEHAQTMRRRAATVVFPEVIASVIAIAIASNFESRQAHPGSITLSHAERLLCIAEGNIEDSRIGLNAGR